MRRDFCDYCEDEITGSKTWYRVVFNVGSIANTVSICHDCYFRIQGFINSLKKK